MVLSLNFFRKMDGSGRFVVPAHIRKEFAVNANEEHELCLINDSGEYYIGFKVNPSEHYLSQLKKFGAMI